MLSILALKNLTELPATWNISYTQDLRNEKLLNIFFKDLFTYKKVNAQVGGGRADGEG